MMTLVFFKRIIAHQRHLLYERQPLTGRTPLHLACLGNNKEAILILMELGAPTTLQDNFGKLPKDYLKANHSAFVDDLLPLFKSATPEESDALVKTSFHSDHNSAFAGLPKELVRIILDLKGQLPQQADDDEGFESINKQNAREAMHQCDLFPREIVEIIIAMAFGS